MSRIKNTFDALKAQNKKALKIFISAGDPDRGNSQEILNALPAAGADMIELGMPFTDPMADGPSVQASSLRALEAGASVKQTLEMLAEFRKTNDTTPVILMGYFNPVYAYGAEKFVQDAASAGADGLIIVDLPPEEDAELRLPAEKAGLDFIKLITPTTHGERLDKVLSSASGFLYYVSIAGVTGTKSANLDEVSDHIQTIKGKTDLPIAIGFGIKTADDAQNMGKIADGIVIGSAIVDTIKEHQNDNDISNIIADRVSGFKKALDN